MKIEDLAEVINLKSKLEQIDEIKESIADTSNIKVSLYNKDRGRWEDFPFLKPDSVVDQDAMISVGVTLTKAMNKRREGIVSRLVHLGVQM